MLDKEQQNKAMETRGSHLPSYSLYSKYCAKREEGCSIVNETTCCALVDEITCSFQLSQAPSSKTITIS